MLILYFLFGIIVQESVEIIKSIKNEMTENQIFEVN